MITLKGRYAPARLFSAHFSPLKASIKLTALSGYYVRSLSSAIVTRKQRAMRTKAVSFELFTLPSTNAGGKARHGRLSCLDRREVETPTYIALSSRGAVPHLSQDTARDNTALAGLHTALEDCECSHQNCSMFIQDL